MANITTPRAAQVAEEPIWRRLYLGRVIACATVVVMVPFALLRGRGALAATTGSTSQGEGVPVELVRGDAAPMPAGWDDEIVVSEWVRSGPLRVAHQKNSAERMAAASGFDAVEVDLRGETDDGGDYRLMHDVYHGYTLRQFLADCRRQGQVAVLDMKYDSVPEGAVDVVVEEGMIGQTIFQVPSGRVAETICERDGRAICWLLNGAGDEDGLREDDLKRYSSFIVGVNICGTVVGREGAESVISAAHSVIGRDGTPLDVCIFAYGDRTDVYGNDELYAALGVDCLMTDRCPERPQRSVMPVD